MKKFLEFEFLCVDLKTHVSDHPIKHEYSGLSASSPCRSIDKKIVVVKTNLSLSDPISLFGRALNMSQFKSIFEKVV